jgi:hypothetical protein
MLKRGLAIFAGIATGFLIVTFGDLISHQFIIVPKDLNQNDKKAFADFIAHIPIKYLIAIVGYWLLSSFFGAMVASLINKNGWRNSSLIVGVILMMGAVANMLMIPHPTWMLVVTVIGYLPIAFLGGNIISLLTKQKN